VTIYHSEPAARVGPCQPTQQWGSLAILGIVSRRNLNG
jgi:hypothetical protein